MNIGKIDTSPRKIFSGLTIPGKKMITMLMGGKRGVVGSLIDVYKEEPSQALTLASTALYSVSEGVAEFGPSFRNSELERHLLVGMIVDNYVEILKDIRDFLKLRFRANGLANTEAEAKVILQQLLGNHRGRISMADSVKQALNKDETGVVLGYVINYVVTALDTLCKNPTAVVGEDEKDIENFLYVLYEDMLHKAILWLSRRRKI